MADDRLARLDRPAHLPLRKALAADIDRLEKLAWAQSLDVEVARQAALLQHVRAGQDDMSRYAAQLEQVVINLLDNAFRYTPEAGEVRLSAHAAGDRVVVEVADNGPGIAPSNLPKIFDRFFTTEPKGLRREYGSGLGLAIAKAIVEGHGGAISAASEPGRGAVFSVSLPRR